MTDNASTSSPSMRRNIPLLGAWALSLGCAVGWGAFMMPGNTFLPVAGPLGTVIGILLGAVIMLIIGVNYHCLMQEYPDAGGAFSFIKTTFSYDHGFVGAWFLLLTYIAIVWANATALPLIGRFLLGDVFQFGFSYRIAGFDIYFGELLLSVGAIVIAGLLCIRGRAALWLQIAMALALCCGVVLCAIAVFSRLDGGLPALSPGFAPGKNKLTAVFTIFAMAPWAFVGFESISHSAEEFSFPVKKALRIMAVALVCGAVIYAALAVIAASTLPEGFARWPDYIAALGSLDVRQGAPVFYAVRTALGAVGTPVLIVTVLGGVSTGLVGNSIAASRLIYAMAKDGMMPRRCAVLNRRGVPGSAILLIMCVSVVIPFLGRTATGWIVDVTTVGSAVVYAYVSGCAFKKGREAGKRLEKATGLIGLVISLIFLLYYLIPNLLAVSAMGRESYLILASWSVIGLVLFRFLLLHDKTNRLGHSTVVWIVLLSLILFTFLVWMRQSSSTTAQQAIDHVHEYQHLAEDGETAQSEEEVDQYIEAQKHGVDTALKRNSLLQSFYVIVSLAALISIYSIIHKREKSIEREKILAEEASRAKTSFLSSMSHEIRTPMNAIIGLDAIALKNPDLSPQTREQLEKIGASANHLLGLINDILDMSRIESGRMTLKNEEFSFHEFLDQINVIVHGQCADKGLDYECHIIGKTNEFYVGDHLKLKQILINILGNAVKFTEAPGSVTFSVEQTAEYEDHCTLRFKMQDTGVGMSQEYLPKIFEAFSQENAGAATRYGSTGLGMAITKNLVEMMNGEIGVESEKGVGTTFTVLVTVRKSDRSHERTEPAIPLAQLRTFVVDDDVIALEHACLVLKDIGIEPHSASSAKEAISRMREQFDAGAPYQLLLTDERMPEMDGIELIRALREFDGGATNVIILTGYSWDDIREQAQSIGVNSIVSKPIFTDSILHEIEKIFTQGGDAPAAAEEASPEGVSLEGLRVLMAEDVALNAEILADLLEIEGMEADHAENGQEAVELFSEHAPGFYCAILMDMRMPVMDGLSATRVIRAMERPDAKTIPIIALSANAFNEDVQRSLQAGLNAHLSKPIDAEKLFETLRKTIAAQK